MGDFVFAPNGHYFAHLGTQLAKSLDSGKTWVALLYPRQFNNLVVDPNGKLYGGPNGGVYASTDEGNSWFSLGGGGDAMAVIRNGWLLTVSSAGNGALLNRSTDGGQTWQRLRDFPGEKLLYDPCKAIVYARWFYHGANFGLYGSSDNGDTWSQLYNDYGYPPGIGPCPQVNYAITSTLNVSSALFVIPLPNM